MRNYLFGIFAFFALVGGQVLAANQQVSPGTYKATSPNSPFYGRSDGLFYHEDSKTPVLIGNGDGKMPLGPTYYEDFSVYADGQSCFAESVLIPGDTGFTVVSSANAICDTTCGQHACIIGVDGTDFIACDGNTADSCLCAKTGLDLYGVCGADWEAGALGVSLHHLASGVKLASVALLEQLIGVDMDADGLDISGDQTDNDGFEILGGLYGASGRPMFPGLDPAFKFCATVGIEDLSGTDEFWVGFRDLTAPNATFNSYNSYAVVGVDNTTGDIHTETEDDGGGTTTTDITVSAWPEGQAQATEFCTLVNDAGVVTYTVGGESASDAVSYTLDNGEPVIPFVHYLHSSDVAGEIILTKWELSYQ